MAYSPTYGARPASELVRDTQDELQDEPLPSPPPLPPHPQRWPMRMPTSTIFTAPHRPPHSRRLYVVHMDYLEGRQIIAGGKDAYLYVVLRIGGRQHTTPFATVYGSAGGTIAAPAGGGGGGGEAATAAGLASKTPSPPPPPPPSALPPASSSSTPSRGLNGTSAAATTTTPASRNVRHDTSISPPPKLGASPASASSTFRSAAPNPVWPVAQQKLFFYWDGRSAMPDVEFIVCARAAAAVNAQRQAVRARAATLATLLEDSDDDDGAAGNGTATTPRTAKNGHDRNSSSDSESTTSSSSSSHTNGHQLSGEEDTATANSARAAFGVTSQRPRPLREAEEAVWPLSREDKKARRRARQTKHGLLPSTLTAMPSRRRGSAAEARANAAAEAEAKEDPVAKQPVQPSSGDSVVGYARVRLDPTMLDRTSKLLVRPPKVHKGGSALAGAGSGAGALTAGNGSTSTSASKGKTLATTAAAAAGQEGPPTYTTVQLGIRNEQDAALLRLFGTLGSLQFGLTAAPVATVQRPAEASGDAAAAATALLLKSDAAVEEEAVVRRVSGGLTTVEAYINHQEEQLRAILDRVTAHEALNRALQRLLGIDPSAAAAAPSSPSSYLPMTTPDRDGMREDPLTSPFGQPAALTNASFISLKAAGNRTSVAAAVLPWAPARGCTLVQATFHPLDPVLDLQDVRSYLESKKERELEHAVRHLEILRRVRQLDPNSRAEWWTAKKRKLVRQFRDGGEGAIATSGGGGGVKSFSFAPGMKLIDHELRTQRSRGTKSSQRKKFTFDDDDVEDEEADAAVPVVTVDALLENRGARLRRLLWSMYTAVSLQVRVVSPRNGSVVREWPSSGFVRTMRGVDPAQAVLWRLQQIRKWRFTQSLVRWSLIQADPSAGGGAESMAAGGGQGDAAGAYSGTDTSHTHATSSSAASSSGSGESAEEEIGTTTEDTSEASGKKENAGSNGGERAARQFLAGGGGAVPASAASVDAPDALEQTLRAGADTHGNTPTGQQQNSNDKDARLSSTPGGVGGCSSSAALPQAPADANGFVWEQLCIYLEEADLLALAVTVRVSVAPPPPLSAALPARPPTASTSSLTASPSITAAPMKELSSTTASAGGGGGAAGTAAGAPGGDLESRSVTDGASANLLPLLLPPARGESDQRGSTEEKQADALKQQQQQQQQQQLNTSTSGVLPSLPPMSAYAHYPTEVLCDCVISGPSIVQQLTLHEEQQQRLLLTSPSPHQSLTTPKGAADIRGMVPLFFPCYAAAPAPSSTGQQSTGVGSGGRREPCGWLRVVLRLSPQFSVPRLRELLKQQQQQQQEEEQQRQSPGVNAPVGSAPYPPAAAASMGTPSRAFAAEHPRTSPALPKSHTTARYLENAFANAAPASMQNANATPVQGVLLPYTTAAATRSPEAGRGNPAWDSATFPLDNVSYDDGEIAAPMPARFVSAIPPMPSTQDEVEAQTRRNNELRGHAFAAPSEANGGGAAVPSEAKTHPALAKMEWAIAAAAASTASAAGTLPWSVAASQGINAKPLTNTAALTKGMERDVLLLSMPTAPRGGLVLRVDQVFAAARVTTSKKTTNSTAGGLTVGQRYYAVLSFPSSVNVRGSSVPAAAGVAEASLPPALLFQARSAPAVRDAQVAPLKVGDDFSRRTSPSSQPRQDGVRHGRHHHSTNNDNYMNHNSTPLLGSAPRNAAGGDAWAGDVAAVWKDATYVLEACGPYLGLPLRVDIVEVPVPSITTPGDDKTSSKTASTAAATGKEAVPRLIGSFVFHYSTLPFVGRHKFPLVPPLPSAAALTNSFVGPTATTSSLPRDMSADVSAGARGASDAQKVFSTSSFASRSSAEAAMTVTLSWSISPELQQQCLWHRLRRLHRESVVDYAVTEAGVKWVFDRVRHTAVPSSMTANISSSEELPQGRKGGEDTEADDGGDAAAARQQAFVQDTTSASVAATMLMQTNGADGGGGVGVRGGGFPALPAVPYPLNTVVNPNVISGPNHVHTPDPQRRPLLDGPPGSQEQQEPAGGGAYATSTPLDARAMSHEHTPPRLRPPPLVLSRPEAASTVPASRNETLCGPGTPPRREDITSSDAYGMLRERDDTPYGARQQQSRGEEFASPPSLHARYGQAGRQPAPPTYPPRPFPSAQWYPEVAQGSYSTQAGNQFSRPTLHSGYSAVAAPPAVQRRTVRRSSNTANFRSRRALAAISSLRLRVTVLSLQNLRLPSSTPRTNAVFGQSNASAGTTLTPYVVVRYQGKMKDNYSLTLPSVHVPGSGGSCGGGSALMYFTVEFDVPPAFLSQPCHLVTVEVRDAFARQVFGVAHVPVQIPTSAPAAGDAADYFGGNGRGKEVDETRWGVDDTPANGRGGTDRSTGVRAPITQNLAPAPPGRSQGNGLHTMCSSAVQQTLNETVTHIVPLYRHTLAVTSGRQAGRPSDVYNNGDVDAERVTQGLQMLSSESAPAAAAAAESVVLDRVASIVGEMTVLTTVMPRPSLDRVLASQPMQICLTVLGARGLLCSNKAQDTRADGTGFDFALDGGGNGSGGSTVFGAPPDAYVIVTVRRCEPFSDFSPSYDADDNAREDSNSSSSSSVRELLDEGLDEARVNDNGVWSTREYRSLTIPRHRSPLWYLELPPLRCSCPADLYTFTVFQADEDGFDVCLGECQTTAGELLEGRRGRTERDSSGTEAGVSGKGGLTSAPQTVQLILSARGETTRDGMSDAMDSQAGGDAACNGGGGGGGDGRGLLLIEWSCFSPPDPSFSTPNESISVEGGGGRSRGRCFRAGRIQTIPAAPAYSSAVVVELQVAAATALALELTARRSVGAGGGGRDTLWESGVARGSVSLPAVLAAIFLENQGEDGGGVAAATSFSGGGAPSYTIVLGTLQLASAMVYDPQQARSSQSQWPQPQQPQPFLHTFQHPHQSNHHRFLSSPHATLPCGVSGNEEDEAVELVSVNATFPSSAVLALSLRSPPSPIRVELWLRYSSSTADARTSLHTSSPPRSVRGRTAELRAPASTSTVLLPSDVFVGEATIHVAALTPCTSPLQDPAAHTTLLRPRRDPRYRVSDIHRANRFPAGLGTLTVRAAVYPVRVYEARQRHQAQLRGWKAELMVAVQEATDFEAEGIYAVEVRCVGSGESHRSRVLRDRNPRFHETFAFTLYAATEMVEVRLLEWPRQDRRGGVDEAMCVVAATASFTVEVGAGGARRTGVEEIPWNASSGVSLQGSPMPPSRLSSSSSASSSALPPVVHTTWLTLQPTTEAAALFGNRNVGGNVATAANFNLPQSAVFSAAGVAPKLLVRWRARVCSLADGHGAYDASTHKAATESTGTPSFCSPVPPPLVSSAAQLSSSVQETANRLQGTRSAREGVPNVLLAKARQGGLPSTASPAAIPEEPSAAKRIATRNGTTGVWKPYSSSSSTSRHNDNSVNVPRATTIPEAMQELQIDSLAQARPQQFYESPERTAAAAVARGRALTSAELQQPLVLNVLWLSGELLSFLGTGSSTARDVIDFCRARCRRNAARAEGRGGDSEASNETLQLQLLSSGNTEGGEDAWLNAGNDWSGGDSRGRNAEAAGTTWLPSDVPLLALVRNGDYVQVGRRPPTSHTKSPAVFPDNAIGSKSIGGAAPVQHNGNALQRSVVIESTMGRQAAPGPNDLRADEDDSCFNDRGVRIVAAALSDPPLHMSRSYAAPVQQQRRLSWLTDRSTLARVNTRVLDCFASYAKADLLTATTFKPQLNPRDDEQDRSRADEPLRNTETAPHFSVEESVRQCSVHCVVVTFLYEAVTARQVQELVLWVQSNSDALRGFCRPVQAAVRQSFHVMERVFGVEMNGQVNAHRKESASQSAAEQRSDSAGEASLTLVDAAEVCVQGTAGALYAMLRFLSRCRTRRGAPVLPLTQSSTPISQTRNANDDSSDDQDVSAHSPDSNITRLVPVVAQRDTAAATSPLVVVEEVVGWVPVLSTQHQQGSFRLATNAWEARQVWVHMAQGFDAGRGAHRDQRCGEDLRTAFYVLPPPQKAAGSQNGENGELLPGFFFMDVREGHGGC